MALNSNFRTLTADNIEGVVSTRNYLKNSFENGSLTGWTELSVALTSGLPTGTPTISATAASSLTLSVTSTTPLSLDKSLLVSVPSALTAGQGFISDAFTLDRMDLGKVITVSFDYERVSGTYNFSGTLGSQTWMVYVYDATAGGANWIQPAGFLGMNQSSSAGRVACTFQSSVVAGQQYRIAVIASQAAAGASSIEFDNFTASRQTAPIGPVVTDWVSYTPTGLFTTNTTYSGRWRRVGQNIEIDALVSFTGAPNAANATVSIPSGLSINTSALSQATQFYSPLLGSAAANDSGNGLRFHVNYYDTSSAVLTYQSSTGALASLVTATVPVSWGNGDNIVIKFTAPISGWSSNVQLSNDTDTRVVAASYSFGNTGLTSTSAISGIWGQVYDTHASFTNANGRYTVPVSGYYRVSVLSARTIGTGNSVGLYRDGVFYQTLFAYSIAGGRCSGSISLYCNAGQYLTFGVDGSFTADMIFSIERLSGPSVIAASETVAARYFKTATQSFSVETKLTGYTRLFDTHGAWDSSNNLYRFPVSGKYLIQIQNNAAPSTVAIGVAGYKINNGTTNYIGNDSPIGASATMQRFGGSSVVAVNAGDYVEIYHFTSAAVTVAPNEQNTHFTITRIGN